MSHFAPSSASICDALIDGLGAYKKGGYVHTVKWLAGKLSDEVALDRLLTSEIPALPVAYFGDIFRPKGTSGRVFSHERKLSVICCAGSFQDQLNRFEQSDKSKAGVEQLLDWATYMVMQMLLVFEGIRLVKVLEHQPLCPETGKYIYEASFSFVCDVDFWEEESTDKVASVGVVHSPADSSHIWKEDNQTPHSTLPPAVSGGMGQL